MKCRRFSALGSRTGTSSKDLVDWEGRRDTIQRDTISNNGPCYRESYQPDIMISIVRFMTEHCKFDVKQEKKWTRAEEAEHYRT